MTSMAIRDMLRQTVETTLSGVRAGLSQIIGICSQPVWRDTDCVFVLSTGRTGTKTLARLLGLSPRCDAYHEPSPQLLEERQAARVEVYSFRGKYRRIFSRSKGEALLRAHRRKRVYVETSARLTFFAPVIASLLPNAKFLFVHRHPVEVIRSGMRRGWYIDHPADYARVKPVEGEPLYDNWENQDQFSKVCWYWDTYNKFALRFCSDVDPSRIQILNAGDLFSGTAVSDIFRFIQLPSPPGEEIESVLQKKLNAQKTAHFPKKENWTPMMYSRLQTIAGETIQQLGYRIPNEQDESTAVIESDS